MFILYFVAINAFGTGILGTYELGELLKTPLDGVGYTFETGSMFVSTQNNQLNYQATFRHHSRILLFFKTSPAGKQKL